MRWASIASIASIILSFSDLTLSRSLYPFPYPHPSIPPDTLCAPIPRKSSNGKAIRSYLGIVCIPLPFRSSSLPSRFTISRKASEHTEFQWQDRLHLRKVGGETYVLWCYLAISAAFSSFPRPFEHCPVIVVPSSSSSHDKTNLGIRPVCSI